MMPLMGSVWRRTKAAALSLPHELAIMGDWQVPAQRLADVQTPTLAMYGGKTETRLKRAVEELVKVLPNVRQQVLPGQTHNVNAGVLVPALVAFFTADARDALAAVESVQALSTLALKANLSSLCSSHIEDIRL